MLDSYLGGMSSGALTRAALCLGLLGAPLSPGVVGQTADNRGAHGDVSDLLDRATTFAERFFRNFSSVVAEERYEQRIRVPAGNRTDRPLRTVLVSDFLMVDIPGEGWFPFRDVFERDGKQIRDRQDRLVDLFLTKDRKGLEQARAISNESTRYNIGGIQRTVNVPTLTIAFLTLEHRSRFAFKVDAREGTRLVISYEEKGRPTIVRGMADANLPVRGRFWFDEGNQAVVRTELRATDSLMDSRVTVSYEHDPALNLWVPTHMEELYRRSLNRVEVSGNATYSKFRRFQVTTTQDIAQ